MQTEIFVYIDLEGMPIQVGQLWMRSKGNRQSASFQYSAGWLGHPGRFALAPDLPLTAGDFHTKPNQQLFGAMGDTAPDRWGRVLMQRAEARRATLAQTAPRTLMEANYLLMVNDFSRQGALRFTNTEGGPFLATDGAIRVPPLIELPQLLSATDRYLADAEGDEDLRMLLAPGSSLGGARPKASVVDQDQTLAIAKFPRHDDDFNVSRWEALALSLAHRAGIPVPEFRLESVAGRDVLILKRFDRHGTQRIPRLSAMSMIGAQDNEAHSYLEILDAIRQYGNNAQADAAQLWRRMVFNILISNTDDHLRNHAFMLHSPEGWSLSPAYDLNPVPVEVKARNHALVLDEHTTQSSLAVALSVAERFGLNLQDAKAIAGDVGRVTQTWRQVAEAMGIRGNEINRMASAFEHADLKQALAS